MRKPLLDVPGLLGAGYRIHKNSRSADALHQHAVVGPLGKPLWTYSLHSDFALGLIAIIAAHKGLTTHGTRLRYGIDAGTLFLLNTDQEPMQSTGEGFIADLDFSLSSWTMAPSKVPPRRLSCSDGDSIANNIDLTTCYDRSGRHPEGSDPSSSGSNYGTGPISFMTTELLFDLLHPTRTPAQRDVHHDLESIIWIVIYALYRWYTHVSTQRSDKPISPGYKALKDEFKGLFGDLSVGSVLFARHIALVNSFKALQDMISATRKSEAMTGFLEHLRNSLLNQSLLTKKKNSRAMERDEEVAADIEALEAAEGQNSEEERLC